MLELINILPEPFRFLAIAFLAVIIGYFIAKITAALIVTILSIKFEADDTRPISPELKFLRFIFWTIWPSIIGLILFYYYSR